MPNKPSDTAASKPAKKATETRRPGRPTDYTPEMAESICEGLAKGSSLPEVCADKGMPDDSTVYRWLDKHEEFQEQYARARERQGEHWAVEGLKVIKALRAGEIDANSARVMIDAFKWYAGKLKPKVYGDHLRHSGGDGGPITVRIIDFGKNSPDEQTY